MKTKLFLLPVLLLLCLTGALAQRAETTRPPKAEGVPSFVNTKKVPLQSLKPPVRIDPKAMAAQKKWNVTLSQHGVIDHGSQVPKNLLDSIKAEGWRLRQLREQSGLDGAPQKELPAPDGSGITPQVKTSFKGNKHNGWVPPDNSIAVSDQGYVVSVINKSMLFATETGTILQEESFEDYLDFLNLNGGYFDPRVIYDPDEDKFIMVVLNGNTPATSEIVIGFSSSGDPTEDWWFYTFSGDPAGSNLWFDYPSIGISTDDLYISGNLFTPNNYFSQTLIYQLDKKPGFSGATVNGLYWNDVRDAFGSTDFTVVPIPYGFDGTYGPGMYFISTDAGGSSDVMLYYMDNNSKSNPNFSVYKVDAPNYYAPFNSQMPGTTDELKTGDSRTQNGFFADGTIHFVYNNRGDDLHSKINYCRVNVNDLSQQTISLGQQPYEWAYPSVAPFTNSPTDRTVLIGFLRSHSTVYPEFRVVSVDNNMQPGTSVPVKTGDSFVNVEAGTQERWGDYSGISKRHSAAGAEVWVAGCYGTALDNGTTNVLSTWIAQITDGQGGQVPVANFSGTPTTVMAGQTVAFSDLSTNTPTGWAWTFPGGTPGNATVKNPTVTYNTPGSYAVTLVAGNSAGADFETKAGYVTVNPSTLPPVANFSATPTTVTAGQTVSFSDLSTNAPTVWAWSFPGGTPGNALSKNPTVTYNTPGTYAVTLVVSNNAGTDSETKAGYITVSAGAQPPVANFSATPTTVTAGQTVMFSDLSTNTPTTWAWSFPGGTPASASVKNPTVTYNTPGTYAVTLVAGNGAGNDAETKSGYITVNPGVQAPVADFTSDVQSVSPGGFVAFEDLSGNTPTSWQWSFPGGLPGTSNLKNPIVIYPSSGCFDVTLVASNAAGSHSVTKSCYIDVTTAVATPGEVFRRFVVFPNPVTSGERLNVEFEIETAAELKFFVVDSRGAVLRELLHRRVKGGSNSLAFNTEPLHAGVYYLTVLDERGAVLRSEKFIVGK